MTIRNYRTSSSKKYFFSFYLKKLGACGISKDHTQKEYGEEESNFEDRMVSDKKIKEKRERVNGLCVFIWVYLNEPNC